MVLVAVGLVAAGGIMIFLAVLRSNSSANLVQCLAKPYTGKTEDELNIYIESRWNNFVVLPSYDEQIHWDMYLLYKSLVGHYSMLFMTPGHIEGFLIHLEVDEDKQTKFCLDAVNLRSYRYKCPDLKALSLGTTAEFTAECIITKAHDRLVNMGHYHTLYNNCLDYCNEVASDVQVSNVCKIWSEELNTILQGIASVTTTGAVAVGAAVESIKCMCIEPQTGSSRIKPIKDLYKEYHATIKKNA